MELPDGRFMDVEGVYTKDELETSWDLYVDLESEVPPLRNLKEFEKVTGVELSYETAKCTAKFAQALTAYCLC